MSNPKRAINSSVTQLPRSWYSAGYARLLSVLSKLKSFITRHRKVAIHLCVWVVYVSFEIIVLYFLRYKINIWEAFFNLATNAALFYFNALYLLPVFLAKKRYLQYALILLITLPFVIGIKYVMKIYVTPLFDAELLYPYLSDHNFVASAIWRYSQFLMYSVGYWYAVSSINHEREKRKLELMKLDHERHIQVMEKNLREAEITYLKNQINPHFLFNTLNFVYERVQHHSDEAARGVMLLSDMMRYALTKSDTNAKVPLDSEIQHLRNYIEIHQLRFNHRLQVRFTVEGPSQYRLITPLVLITFVENCFKHGELRDARHPLTIRLQLDHERLSFYTGNKKKIGPTEYSPGIGLSNTRKRLEAIYGDRYHLDVDDGSEFYTSHLTIEL